MFSSSYRCLVYDCCLKFIFLDYNCLQDFDCKIYGYNETLIGQCSCILEISTWDAKMLIAVVDLMKITKLLKALLLGIQATGWSKKSGKNFAKHYCFSITLAVFLYYKVKIFFLSDFFIYCTFVRTCTLTPSKLVIRGFVIPQ